MSPLEIKQITVFTARNMQIVDKLGPVRVGELFNRFKLKDKLALYYKVCKILTHNIIFISNIERNIIACLQTAFFKLIKKCVMIALLKQPRAKNGINPETTAYNFIR